MQTSLQQSRPKLKSESGLRVRDDGTKSVATAVVDAILRAGTDDIFALPGGTIAPVLDACLDRSVRVMTSRHESGAMFAAAGYARATDRVGVVCVTSGPGILNAMTGLAAAHCEGIPLLVLAGEVPRALHGRKSLQEGTAHNLNVVAMARLVSKMAMEVTQPESVPAIIERAIRTATSGRPGPVVLTIPMDVSLAQIRVPTIASEVHVSFDTRTRAMGRAIERAAKSLLLAKTPVLFVGSGGRHGSAPTQLTRLAERLNAPVMTTPKAKGIFPESHPLSLGVFGHGGHPSTTAYLERGVDVLLAVGTSLSDPGTDGFSKLLRARKEFIQIDVDAMQLGRNYPVTQGLIGDAETLLGQLASRLPRRPAVRSFGVKRHSDPANDHGTPITPQRALWELQQMMPADTYYTCDIGEHLLFATHYLAIDRPGAFMVMNGLASMGSGFGASLGVQVALPDRPVVAICGDGTFAMLGTEIGTATAARLPLVVMVLNDQRYGMVELGNRAIYGRTPTYSTRPMDVAEFAAAHGARSKVIRQPGDILATDLTRRREPIVLDVRIDPRAKMPKNARFDELKRAARAKG